MTSDLRPHDQSNVLATNGATVIPTASHHRLGGNSRITQEALAEVNVNADVVSAIDILSGESVAARDGKLTVTVPMGVLRVIDIEHR